MPEFLYGIGPKPSHVTEILHECGDLPCVHAEHGEVHRVIQSILRIKEAASSRLREDAPSRLCRYSEETLLPRLVRLLESAAETQSDPEETVRELRPDGQPEARL